MNKYLLSLDNNRPTLQKQLDELDTLQSETEVSSASSVSDSKSVEIPAIDQPKIQLEDEPITRIRQEEKKEGRLRSTPRRREGDQSNPKELNFTNFLEIAKPLEEHSSDSSEQPSGFTALVYNIDVLLEKIRECDFNRAASPTLKRIQGFSKRLSICSDLSKPNRKAISRAASIESVPSSKLGPKSGTSSVAQALLKSEFQNSSHLKSLLMEELSKAEEKQFERVQLLASLSLASSKRRKADISHIEGFLEKFPQFEAIKSSLDIDDLSEFARAIQLVHLTEFTELPLRDLQVSFIVKGVISARRRNKDLGDWEGKWKEYETLFKWKQADFSVAEPISNSRALSRKSKVAQATHKLSACLSPNFLIEMRRASNIGTPSSRSTFKPIQKHSSKKMIEASMLFVGKQLKFAHIPEIEEEQKTSEEEVKTTDLKLKRFSELKALQWFEDVGEHVSGGSFSYEGQSEVSALACCDCHLAVLSTKIFNQVVRKIQRDQYDRKIQFFKAVPCLSKVGMKLLKRLINLFTLQKANRGQLLYKQGTPADRVYVILDGEFKVDRQKQNKMTNREMEYKKVRYLNDQRKPDSEQLHDIKTFKQIQQRDRKLPPTLIRLTSVGKGSMLGQEDVINERNYTSTVRCSSMSAQVYWISKEQFLTQMISKPSIWEPVVEDCLIKDQNTKDKVISATHNKERYAQFFKKMQLRENWNRKHNFNIQQKQRLGDWRSAFKYIVSSNDSTLKPSSALSTTSAAQEDKEQEKKSQASRLDHKPQQTQQMKEAKEANELSFHLIRDMGKNEKKQMMSINNKIAQFIDTWDQVKLPSKKQDPIHKSSSQAPILKSPQGLVIEERKQKKKLERLKRMEQLEMNQFRSLQVRRKSSNSDQSRLSWGFDSINQEKRHSKEAKDAFPKPSVIFKASPQMSNSNVTPFQFKSSRAISLAAGPRDPDPNELPSKPNASNAYRKRLQFRQTIKAAGVATNSSIITSPILTPKDADHNTMQTTSPDLRSVASSLQNVVMTPGRKVPPKPMPLKVMMARSHRARPATQAGGVALEKMKTLPMANILEYGMSSQGSRRLVQAKTELRKEPVKMSYDLMEKQKQTTVKIQEYMKKIRSKNLSQSTSNNTGPFSMNTRLTEPTSDAISVATPLSTMNKFQRMKPRNINQLDEVKVPAMWTPQGIKLKQSMQTPKAIFGAKLRIPEETKANFLDLKSIPTSPKSPPNQYQRRFSKFKIRTEEDEPKVQTKEPSLHKADSSSISSRYERLSSMDVECFL